MLDAVDNDSIRKNRQDDYEFERLLATRIPYAYNYSKQIVGYDIDTSFSSSLRYLIHRCPSIPSSWETGVARWIRNSTSTIQLVREE